MVSLMDKLLFFLSTVDLKEMFWWSYQISCDHLSPVVKTTLSLKAHQIHVLADLSNQDKVLAPCLSWLLSAGLGANLVALQAGGQMILHIWASVGFFTEITFLPKGSPPRVLRKPDTVQRAVSRFLIPRLYDPHEPSVWTAADRLSS